MATASHTWAWGGEGLKIYHPRLKLTPPPEVFYFFLKVDPGLTLELGVLNDFKFIFGNSMTTRIIFSNSSQFYKWNGFKKATNFLYFIFSKINWNISSLSKFLEKAEHKFEINFLPHLDNSQLKNHDWKVSS